MERLSIIIRLSAAWLLLTTMADLSKTLGARIAAITSPHSAIELSEVVQTRRSMMERLAEARVRGASDPIAGERLLLSVFSDARDPEVRSQAATLLLELVVNEWPRGHRQDFLASVLPAALESGSQNRLPPSIILAQAVLESGWGRSQLAINHHNLFGIKAGTKQSGVTLPTLEATAKGVAIREARFRQFESVTASIQAHGTLLSTDARYENARQYSGNWRQFLAELSKVYASDPQYAGHITQIVTLYGLDRWDSLASLKPSATAQS